MAVSSLCSIYISTSEEHLIATAQTLVACVWVLLQSVTETQSAAVSIMTWHGLDRGVFNWVQRAAMLETVAAANL